MATIGIGIPVRNGERYLPQALAGALCQTAPADEVLAVINNSSDASLSLCESYGPRVRVVVDNSIKSIGEAWNAVYAHSSCDYVVMLHQDDLLYPETIEVLRRTIVDDPVTDVFYGKMAIVSAEGDVLGVNFDDEEVSIETPEYLHRAMWGYLPGCSGLCSKRGVMLETRYRPDLDILLDVEFFIRIGWSAKVKGLPQLLSAYRLHGDSTLHSGGPGKAEKDLLRWWQAVASQEVRVPPEITETYRAALFKRVVTAFLHDLWNGRRRRVDAWHSFMAEQLTQHPYLRHASFTARSKVIYGLSRSGRFGYELAYQVARLREGCRLLRSGRRLKTPHKLPGWNSRARPTPPEMAQR